MKKNIFENPVIEILNLVGKLIILNFLWILCCIPVITIGAATSAMYSVMFKIVDNADGLLFLPYFKAFKNNFIQSTAIWFIILFVGSIFGFDLFYARYEEGILGKVFIFIAIAGLLVVLNILTLVFAIQSRYTNTVKNHIKNAFIIAYLSPLKIILVWIVWIVPISLTIYSYQFFRYFGFIWFVCGFSIVFFYSSRIILSIFRKAIKEEKEKLSVQNKKEEE